MEEAYQRIVKEGHTLANHTWSHQYSLYNSPDAFYADVEKLDAYQKTSDRPQAHLPPVPFSGWFCKCQYYLHPGNREPGLQLCGLERGMRRWHQQQPECGSADTEFYRWCSWTQCFNSALPCRAERKYPQGIGKKPLKPC